MSTIVSYTPWLGLVKIQTQNKENITIKYSGEPEHMSNVELNARVALERLNSIFTSKLSLYKSMLCAFSAVNASISTGASLIFSRIHSTITSHSVTKPALKIEISDEASELDHAIIHVVESDTDNTFEDYQLKAFNINLAKLGLEDAEERTY